MTPTSTFAPAAAPRMTDNYRLLMGKLDDFVRKYYVDQLIRGALYCTGLILLLFISLNVLEYYYYFSTSIRKTMFWSFVGISGVALLYWVGQPLLKYFRLGATISHAQAAQIIGQHFSPVQDRLLNVLQLRQMADVSADNRDLITASIQQKAEAFKLVPFQKAIDLSENKKHLRYALPPLLLLLLLLSIAPAILREGTYRLLNNSTIFSKPAPFDFQLQNSKLSVVQFSDFDLRVRTKGKVRPNELFIAVNGFQYRLQPQTDGSFSHTFVNVQDKKEFYLFAGPVRSKIFNLEVIKKPNIAQFDVKLDFPAYLGRPDEALTNTGDLVVPVGTNINWLFDTEHTDALKVAFGNEPAVNISKAGAAFFALSKRASIDQSYRLYISNAALPNADSVSYTITVTPDLYPSLNIERFVDSLRSSMVFFAGDASDDHAIAKVTFNYTIKKADGSLGAPRAIPLPNTNGKATQFEYKWDIADLKLMPGEELTYYFEAWDNDGVNGSKSTKSNLMTYSLLSEAQMDKQEDKNNEDIKRELKEAVKESKDIQAQLQKMKEKLLQQEEVDWQTKKEFQKLTERQQELDKQMQQTKEKFEQNLQNQQQFDPADERLLEKQMMVEQLFEELENPEMKALMEQIQEMLEQLNKDEALENMDEMQMDNKEMEKELDRMLELFKKLEVETGIEEQIEKLEELAEKQEELAKDAEKGEKTPEQLEQEQKEIDKEFDKVQEELDALEKKNEELESPMDFDKQEEKQEQIDQDQKNAGDQLKKKDKAKAGKSQKGAANKMKEMANDMAAKMKSGDAEQQEEDMAAMRQLLDNLVHISYDQEALMNQLQGVTDNTPLYLKMVQQQYKLKDDFGIVEDSLQALAKRVYQIEAFITEKVTEINDNMSQGLTQLEERKRPQAAEQQQRTMKNVNDLALLLSETMNQMQQQMSGMAGGSKSCPKPGDKPGKEGKKPGDKPGDKMSEGQQGLNEQMKKMAEKMKAGKGGPGGQPGSQEFAKMAAQQAALREAMRKKQKEMQQRGKGDPSMQQILDQMDKVETDLVNKTLNTETLKRQEDILTRLLESERAERERGLDERRQAETAREVQRTPPPALQEYLKKRQAEIELFKTVSPSLTPYYKQLVEQYYKSTRE